MSQFLSPDDNLHAITPALIEKTLAQLPKVGRVKKMQNGFVYLKIDDDYIHRLFSLFREKGIEKPNYFDDTVEEPMGAHISIFYTEEEIKIKNKDLGKTHHFTVDALMKTDLFDKTYYTLKVISPSLVDLRQQYGLTEKLLFINQWLDFHITVAVKNK